MQTKFREWIKGANYDFMSKANLFLLSSAIVVSVSLLALLFNYLVRGQILNFGLDFTGGTIVEAVYANPVEIPAVRNTLSKAGFGDAQTQYFGTSKEVQIRIPPHGGLNTADISSRVLEALQAGDASVKVQRVEFVGPQVGQELVEQGGLALLIATIGILIYVAIRFEWRLALGTVLALAHDPLIVLGIFAIFWLDFDLTVLAALLAIIGYSVNDSVVVLDRIRENFRKLRKGSAYEIMNVSINQTLSRTIMTSFTTLLSVLVMLIVGGPVMRNFSLAMVIGIVFGTYSSIYIASAIALRMGIKREDLLPKTREAVDDRP